MLSYISLRIAFRSLHSIQTLLKKPLHFRELSDEIENTDVIL